MSTTRTTTLMLLTMLAAGCAPPTAADGALVIQGELATARSLAHEDPAAARAMADGASALLDDMEASELGTPAERAMLRDELDATELVLERAAEDLRDREVPVERVTPLVEAGCGTRTRYFHQYVARHWYCDPPPTDENAPPRTSTTWTSSPTSTSTYRAAASPFCRWVYYVAHATVYCSTYCPDPTQPDVCESDRPEALETFDQSDATVIGEPVTFDCNAGDRNTCGLVEPAEPIRI